MTIALGALLPTGILILADTRIVTREPNNGDICRYWDDVQKVYVIPPFIVGFAGDCVAGFIVLKMFRSAMEAICEHRLRHGDPLIFGSDDIEDYLPQSYHATTKVLGYSPRVSVIAGALHPDGRIVGSRDLTRIAQRYATIRTGGIRDLAAAASAIGEPLDNALLVRFDFPSERISYAQNGQVLCIGSGAYMDTVLDGLHAMVMSELPPDADRMREIERDADALLIDLMTRDTTEAIFESMAGRLKAFHQNHCDSTFNECIHGYVVERDGRLFAKWTMSAQTQPGTLRFSSAGTPIKHLRYRNRLDVLWGMYRDMLKTDKIGARQLYENLGLGTAIDMIYRRGRFWIVHEPSRRGYRMRSALTWRGSLRQFGGAEA